MDAQPHCFPEAERSVIAPQLLFRDAKEPTGKAVSESEESTAFYKAVAFAVSSSKHIA